MSALADAAFLTWLKEQGYLHPRPLREGWYAAIQPLMFTHAIIIGHMGDETGYEDRWCFSNYAKAKAALDAWDGTGEPEGWHRHPSSGRRRAEGEPSLEYVAP